MMFPDLEEIELRNPIDFLGFGVILPWTYLSLFLVGKCNWCRKRNEKTFAGKATMFVFIQQEDTSNHLLIPIVVKLLNYY